MDTKSSILAAVAFVALLLGTAAFMRPAQVVQQVADQTPPPYGSASSPSLVNGCQEINGVTHCDYKTAMNTTASTSCSFYSPSQGTSTLIHFSWKVSSTTGASTIWELGQAKNIDATTTLIGTKYNVSANALASVIGSTSPAAGDATLFAPHTGVSLKQGGVQTGGVGGVCDATFIVI